MKAKRIQFSIRLPEPLIVAIDKMALDEVRDRTGMIEKILTDYVRKAKK